MKRSKYPGLPVLVACALVWATGCKDSTPATPEALTTEQAPTTIQEAFAKATGETKEMADDAVKYLTEGDHSKSLLVLQRLLQQTDLTPDQRKFTSQALLTANEQVSKSAEQGNEQAQRLLRQRAANK
jgi:hypothetical protein